MRPGSPGQVSGEVLQHRLSAVLFQLPPFLLPCSGSAAQRTLSYGRTLITGFPSECSGVGKIWLMLINSTLRYTFFLQVFVVVVETGSHYQAGLEFIM